MKSATRDELGRLEIEAFLTHLAVQQQVAASTQNQALSAILFLYREVLNLEVAGVSAIRAKRTQYLPTVLTPQEARAAIQNIGGVQQLVVHSRNFRVRLRTQPMLSRALNPL